MNTVLLVIIIFFEVYIAYKFYIFLTSKFKLVNLPTYSFGDVVFGKLKDFVFVTDSNLNIVKYNYIVSSVLGYEEHEIINNSITRFTLNKAFFMQDISAFLDSNMRYLNFEADLCTSDNTVIPVVFDVSRLKNTNNEDENVLFVGHDIKLTKQLKNEIAERSLKEEELRSSNDKLKELNRVKTDFLSTISHEFRTPLTSILGFSKIINKKLKTIILPNMDTDNPKVKEVLLKTVEDVGIIISEGERLTELINDILDISKIEAGKTSWKMEKVSMEEIMNTAFEKTSEAISAKKLKFIKNFEDADFYVFGDFERLVQVFVNLVSNAIKFTDEGSITVKIKEKDNNFLSVSIIDTGAGIHEEDIERIFHSLRRAGNIASSKTYEVDLSISICKQIIEYHGGEIWVKSKVGEGSEFTFTLPRIGGETSL